MRKRVIVPFSQFLKDTVTITRPMPSVYMRGLASSHEAGRHVSFRIEENEVDTIERAAGSLSMSRSSFIRWCAYFVAVDILQQKREYDRR